MTGIIVKALSGFYYLNSDGEIYECRAKGGFRKDGISPLVGDRAVFEPLDGGKGFVTEILPRKNALQRPPVVNIDKLFIISAFENPEPNTYIIDKITAIAEYLDIEPIIVFNKCDMGDFTEFEQIYKNSGFKTLTVSAVSKEGIDAVKDELKGCISAFTGNSGVGKSSIINAVMGNGAIATGEVSQKSPNITRIFNVVKENPQITHIPAATIISPRVSPIAAECIRFKRYLNLYTPAIARISTTTPPHKSSGLSPLRERS